MRETRQAVGSEFLGSLESFLVFLESLMEYCKLFLADKAAEAAMKASFCSRHECCLAHNTHIPDQPQCAQCITSKRTSRGAPAG